MKDYKGEMGGKKDGVQARRRTRGDARQAPSGEQASSALQIYLLSEPFAVSKEYVVSVSATNGDGLRPPALPALRTWT
jgi:hypothetical protein